MAKGDTRAYRDIKVLAFETSSLPLEASLLVSNQPCFRLGNVSLLDLTSHLLLVPGSQFRGNVPRPSATTVFFWFAAD